MDVPYKLATMALAAVTLLGGSTCGSNVRKPAQALEAPEPRDPLAQEVLLAEVNYLCGDAFAGRGSYQEGSLLASSFVYRELSTLGYRVLRQSVRAPYAENIIAIKEGDERAVIVAAHHDHLGVQGHEVYRGADDNASGLAVLLGMARANASLTFKRTLIFVSFGAEEDGLVGSSVYIQDPVWPLNKTDALINFDMVGRNFFEAGADQASAAAIVGLEASPLAQKIVLRAAKEVGLKAIIVPARLLELFGLHDRTDDWWFRRQGIASFHFSTGLHKDYHQPSDTVEKIVPAQLSRVAQTAQQLLHALAVLQPVKRI